MSTMLVGDFNLVLLEQATQFEKKTAVVQKVIRRLNLVAWTGIEPVTRGFSIRCSTN